MRRITLSQFLVSRQRDKNLINGEWVGSDGVEPSPGLIW